MNEKILYLIPIFVVSLAVYFAYYAYDADGQTTCMGMKELLYGQVLPGSFSTTSRTFVDTGFPANPNFTKQYNESQIWIMFNADNKNSLDGASNFISTNIDGIKQGTWARVMAGPDRLDTFTGITVRTIPSGDHNMTIKMRVGSGNGTLQTQALGLHIYEVCLN